MEKLFNDADTFQKERPTKITQQQEQDFYKEAAEEIKKSGWSKSNLDDIIHDLKEISPTRSGYEIAKSLEGFPNRASYDIDTEFISFLDDLDYSKRCILDKNVQQWAAAHNPQPKFAKGQKLMVDTTLNYKRNAGAIIFVTGFSEGTACYLVDENETRKGGTVIPYEKVESCCTPIQ